jgi:DNA-binding NtrC family response regulator
MAFSPSPSPEVSAPAPLVRLPKGGLNFDEVVGSFELSLLNQALTVSGGNKARAADLLQIKRTTLLAKMKSLTHAIPSGEVADSLEDFIPAEIASPAS